MAVNDDQLVERLVPKVLSAIRAKAKPVESLNVKHSMEGITSMPCYDTTGEQFRAVLVPINILRGPALEAETNANIALENANNALDLANRTNSESSALLEALTNGENERITNETIRINSEASRVEAENDRVSEFNSMKEDNEDAVNSALDTANHPTYIGTDNYVYQWDKEAQSYNKTDIYVRGESFSISKVYNSIVEMENDMETTFKEGDFCLINTNNVEDPDDAKLYVRTKEGTWSFLVDMSGAIGFTGKTPQIFVGEVAIGSGKNSLSITLTSDGVDADGNPKYRFNYVIPCLAYEDLTEEQIAELQKPANDAIIAITELNEELKTHPPVINNDIWEVWDVTNKVYVSTNVYARGRSPYIDNGVWMVWDDSTNTFVSTNINIYPKISEIENDANYINAVETDNEEVKEAYLNGNKVNLSTSASAVLMGNGLTLSDYISFYEGHIVVSTLNNLPSSKRLVIASINESQELSFGDIIVPDGREIHIIVNNSSTSSITIALPNSGNYVCLSDTALSLDAGAYAEVNVISDGSKMYIRSI